jgi:rod shape-determining protein MreD
VNWLSVPVLALAAVVQATFVPQIRILGGGPDLILLFVLAWSLNSKLEHGVTWAFVGGIMQDLMSAAPTGVSTLGMLLIVFAIHLIRREVVTLGFVLTVTLVVAGTITYYLVFMVMLNAVGFQFRLIDSFGTIILPTLIYNLAFIWPVYWIARQLQRRVTGRVVA